MSGWDIQCQLGFAPQSFAWRWLGNEEGIFPSWVGGLKHKMSLDKLLKKWVESEEEKVACCLQQEVYCYSVCSQKSPVDRFPVLAGRILLNRQTYTREICVARYGKYDFDILGVN